VSELYSAGDTGRYLARFPTPRLGSDITLEIKSVSCLGKARPRSRSWYRIYLSPHFKHTLGTPLGGCRKTSYINFPKSNR